VVSRESTGDVCTVEKPRGVSLAQHTLTTPRARPQTTFTLLECAEMVVTPLAQSMSLLAWQVRRSGRPVRSWHAQNIE
jgi:hypothetical protein